jgi:hypothetical protein
MSCFLAKAVVVALWHARLVKNGMGDKGLVRAFSKLLLNPFDNRGPQAPSPAKLLVYTNIKNDLASRPDM